MARRRGKGRAILSVAHSLIQAIWHMRRDEVAYIDFGVGHYQRQDKEKLTQRLVKQLERLGHQVMLQPAA